MSFKNDKSMLKVAKQEKAFAEFAGIKKEFYKILLELNDEKNKKKNMPVVVYEEVLKYIPDNSPKRTGWSSYSSTVQEYHVGMTCTLYLMNIDDVKVLNLGIDVPIPGSKNTDNNNKTSKETKKAFFEPKKNEKNEKNGWNKSEKNGVVMYEVNDDHRDYSSRARSIRTALDSDQISDYYCKPKYRICALIPAENERIPFVILNSKSPVVVFNTMKYVHNLLINFKKIVNECSLEDDCNRCRLNEDTNRRYGEDVKNIGYKDPLPRWQPKDATFDVKAYKNNGLEGFKKDIEVYIDTMTGLIKKMEALIMPEQYGEVRNYINHTDCKPEDREYWIEEEIKQFSNCYEKKVLTLMFCIKELFKSSKKGKYFTVPDEVIAMIMSYIPVFYRNSRNAEYHMNTYSNFFGKMDNTFDVYDKQMQEVLLKGLRSVLWGYGLQSKMKIERKKLVEIICDYIKNDGTIHRPWVIVILTKFLKEFKSVINMKIIKSILFEAIEMKLKSLKTAGEKYKFIKNIVINKDNDINKILSYKITTKNLFMKSINVLEKNGKNYVAILKDVFIDLTREMERIKKINYPKNGGCA